MQTNNAFTATATAAPAPRALQLSDLAQLAQAVRAGRQPSTIFDAVHALAAEVIGFKLFTIMYFDADCFEVERLFTNMPAIYPLSGRKKKRGSAWGEHTLRLMKPFRAAHPDGIRQAFDDHETLIEGLGLGSILNIPIAYDGKCVGTMNLTHVEGWYREEHEQIGVLLGSFLAAPLAMHAIAAMPAAQPLVP